MLLSSTRVGDVVLDPFFGSGTTGAVARKMRRHFIGLEREDAYIKVASERISGIEPLAEPELLDIVPKRAQKRIPFGRVIEAGLLKAGDMLTCKKGTHVARLRADGTLVASNHNGNHAGSIHKVGAALQGAASCNGWTFWHYWGADGLLPIDVLRQQLRAQSETG